MELREEFLTIIAGHIADLRLKYSLMREVLSGLGINVEIVDKIADEALLVPEFQQTYAFVLEQLREAL